MNTSPLLLQAALAAAGGQQYPAGTLYLVATPIGNRADITLRALHVLNLVDLVACEDTRTSAGLLQPLGIDKPLLALHEHNEAQAAQRVVERLAQGQRVGFISDAGTPAVSDPGARLVAAVRAAGHAVVPVPGASSVVAALSAAGDVAAGGFRFAGFLPAKGPDRARGLQALTDDRDAVVLFEAPHRIEALAEALAAARPQRPVTVCRELTKQFESIVTMPAEDLPGWFAGEATRRRGEFVLVLHAQPAPVVADDDALEPAIERTLAVLLAELPLKQAVGLASTLSGAPRNRLYQRALALRDGGADAGQGGEPP